MEITGEISEIIFQNEINSYTIALLKTQSEEVTVVGFLPFVTVGDSLKLSGKYVMHPEYGRQFKLDSFEKIMPETLDSLERYLGNGTIKGVGPATAKRIVNNFQEETLYVLKFEPERLANIKGISENKALEISAQFNENWEVWQIVGFLEKFGIGVQNARKVYNALGKDAVSKIENNPYMLIDITNSVDFRIVDKIALEMGIETNNVERIRSGIKYALIKATYNGHCTVLIDELRSFVGNLLNVDIENINETIIEMRAKKEIYLEERNGQKWIYLFFYYQIECDISQKLQELNGATNDKEIPEIEEEVHKIEEETQIFLSDKQMEAIKAINTNNVCIITGGPGTGKTTIIKTIIELYKKHQRKALLCAPTGRAAKRMTETTGEEAKTLHRLLDIGKLETDSVFPNIDVDISPLDGDVVIVDEMSMVDVMLMNYLVKALYQGTKLVLVGDADQLPSVGAGNVLHDLINSEQIVTITLNKIFRQAAKSKIIINSHRINKGELFVKNSEELNNDFFYIKNSDSQSILEEIISLCNGRLKKAGSYDFFKNIQVISPTKKGSLGTRELNKKLQETLNPPGDLKPEKNIMGIIYRLGDKVMQTKNNYDIYWEKEDEFGDTGTGIFNGELGTIEEIDMTDKKLKVCFDENKVAWYQFAELDQIEHAYAITVHKAQR